MFVKEMHVFFLSRYVEATFPTRHWKTLCRYAIRMSRIANDAKLLMKINYSKVNSIKMLWSMRKKYFVLFWYSFKASKIYGMLSRLRRTWSSEGSCSDAADRWSLCHKVRPVWLLNGWSPVLHPMLLRYDVQSIWEAQRWTVFNAMCRRLQRNLRWIFDEFNILYR